MRDARPCLMIDEPAIAPRGQTSVATLPPEVTSRISLTGAVVRRQVRRANIPPPAQIGSAIAAVPPLPPIAERYGQLFIIGGCLRAEVGQAGSARGEQ